MTPPSSRGAGGAPERGGGRNGDVRSSWLVRLRWGSVAGQVAIIFGARQLAHLDLPMGTLLGLAALMALSNLALALWLRRARRPISAAWTGSILAFDMLQLTLLLYASGGAANPFSVFYLVQITAAAATLGSRWTWFLTALGVSGYAALFALPAQLPSGDMDHGAHQFGRHLRAMWVALTLAAALTAFFVTRLTTGLARRDREIAAMREDAAGRERLSALTTLAAGAAHELATPLTTVAVVAGELERAAAAGALGGRIQDDIRLVRAEVARCREILDEMMAGSGDAAGEMPTTFRGGELVREITGRLEARQAARIRCSVEGDDAPLFLPRRALGRVISSLLQNALDAAPNELPIDLHVSVGQRLHVVVRDEGGGMPEDVLSRATEPFFTTKPQGHGLGLGLFLARSFAEQLGGHLAIESTPGHGTTARLDLPPRIGSHAVSA